MTEKFSWTVAATIIAVALSVSVVRAATGVHDSITGLPMMYYNGTLCDLQRQGLPISQAAKDYLKQHPNDCALGQATGPRARQRTKTY